VCWIRHWASWSAGRYHHSDNPNCSCSQVKVTFLDSSPWVLCAVLCCAVLCCAVLCCAVLCCAVLCCAVLCCAVLCCAVPCSLPCPALPCPALPCPALPCPALNLSATLAHAQISELELKGICMLCRLLRLLSLLQHMFVMSLSAPPVTIPIIHKTVPTWLSYFCQLGYIIALFINFMACIWSASVAALCHSIWLASFVSAPTSWHALAAAFACSFQILVSVHHACSSPAGDIC